MQIQKTAIFATFLTFILIELAEADANATVAVNATESPKDQNEERVMYSYSEALVDSNGNTTVSQLTIAKGKDAEYHYVKTNTNGTVTTGKWEGPLPSTPDVNRILNEQLQLSNATHGIANQLEALNDSIGSSLQNYLRKTLKF